MTLQEMIGHRRSCRSYRSEAVDGEQLEKILSFEMKPLYPGIKVRMEILRRDQIRCIFPWTPPQVMAVYSEEGEGYPENVGFLFQQMELYLQTLGLGACWLGMGKLPPRTAPTADGMKFVIMLAFGYPKDGGLRREPEEFRRKPLSRIADREDARLAPAGLAPSSINSQPWYFIHEGELLHVYCTAGAVTGYMNRIDMGIALAHLYLSNPETFRTFKKEAPPAVPGRRYICSCQL